MSSIEIIREGKLTDEQDTGTDVTVYGINAPGEGIMKEMLWGEP